MTDQLRDIKRDVQELPLAQLQKLHLWLQELILRSGGAEPSLIKTGGGRQVVEEHHADGKTYRLEHVRCGKRGCKCAAGSLHGPYWYAYWFEKGRTRSRYVGKRRPELLSAPQG